MEFLGAFLVCGFLCLMVQLASELLPQVPGPTLFLAVQAVGALLVPTGMIAALTACGETGIVVTVLGRRVDGVHGRDVPACRRAA